ncbi:unnamed protein product [Caenorhabditis angaria]|uniref:Uncharacterized protein n=1 Tax=Caenorhabditis angaria TaxID=860376 RepID=A0A9P1NBX4_9PELO|nr:unnamed protein product [Caenorhabditis angaria]
MSVSNEQCFSFEEVEKIPIIRERETKEQEIYYQFHSTIQRFVNRSQYSPIPESKDADLIKIHRRYIVHLIRKIFVRVNKIRLFIVVPEYFYAEIENLIDVLIRAEKTLSTELLCDSD